MISVEQALSLVLGRAAPLPPRKLPVREAAGLVLAEDATSDIDSPPHDKAMVDGYALRASDLAGGQAQLRVVEEVAAGAVPQREIAAGCAARIMTGAPIPCGADAVVMVEQTRLVGDAEVLIEHGSLEPHANILRRGTSLRQGEVVLERGAEIRPVEVGLLCEIGSATVSAVPRPRVAVLATGNELVSASEQPGPGRIRNSNSPMLAAAVDRAGAEAVELGIARDEPEELARRIALGLEYDVLLLSGGVSAGVLDLVPGVLERLGVEQVFHKVQLKPGKPLWFGTKATDAAARLVFGLPGNPLGSLVCFELFVRPALAKLAGRHSTRTGSEAIHARLSEGFRHRGNRPTYWPGRLAGSPDGATVRPVAWHGSADLRGFAAANALIHFAAGDRLYAAGEEVESLPLWG